MADSVQQINTIRTHKVLGWSAAVETVASILIMIHETNFLLPDCGRGELRKYFQEDKIADVCTMNGKMLPKANFSLHPRAKSRGININSLKPRERI